MDSKISKLNISRTRRGRLLRVGRRPPRRNYTSQPCPSAGTTTLEANFQRTSAGSGASANRSCRPAATLEVSCFGGGCFASTKNTQYWAYAAGKLEPRAVGCECHGSSTGTKCRRCRDGRLLLSEGGRKERRGQGASTCEFAALQPESRKSIHQENSRHRSFFI